MMDKKTTKSTSRLIRKYAPASIIVFWMINIIASRYLPEDKQTPLWDKRGPRSVMNDRNFNDEICVTTLDRNKLDEKERGLLVFSAPPKLESLPSSLKSWRDALRGRGKLVIFTNDPQTRAVCKENDVPTVCVEHSDEGLPLVDKMFERMHKIQTDGVVAYVNSDITVVDFNPMSKILKVLKSSELEVYEPSDLYKPYISTGRTSAYWFVVSSRTDIDWDGSRSQHELGGYDFWAWNTKPDGPALLPFSVPHFRFPLSVYDNWILDMLVQSGQRNVIDAGYFLDILHYAHKRAGNSSTWLEAMQKGITGVAMNVHLAFNRPPEARFLHHTGFGKPIQCPYVIKKDERTGDFMISRRKYWSDLSHEDLLASGCIDDELCEQRIHVLCKTQEKRSYYPTIPFGFGPAKAHDRLQFVRTAALSNWRYTIKEQLKKHARDDGFVLLTAVNFAYRHQLMNFKCTLERVGMRDHFVVAALDEKIYEWGVLRGLPIFLASSGDECSFEDGDCGYGSKNFASVTKLKSATVLKVLNENYSVVWSDVDIMWFVHPFDALAPYMKKEGGIVIQSNTPHVANVSASTKPHETVDAIPAQKYSSPAARYLNSGLYVAPCNKLVKQAFKEIVEHALHSKLTEQPSFDEILCRSYPSVQGSTRCLHRSHDSFAKITNLFGFRSESATVGLLDSFQFPHGGILVGKKNENIFVLGKEEYIKQTGIVPYAAHNNWIKGENEKKKRQVDAGWWFADSNSTCTYPGDSFLDLHH